MAKQVMCPYCRKNPANPAKNIWPFCSERCKSLDLGSWAKEDYRIAGSPADQDADSKKQDKEDLAD